ncbi:MAG: PEP-CTERM sorting domain-containing protein, partial [Burkholderiales bacterium]|nr:PEP-CTERM sorting domain-containing protein [Burkholderiales bacterium]
MKKLILASLLSATTLFGSAFAAEVTSLNDGELLAMPTLNYFGSGPQALGSNATWTANSSSSVFGYANGYGFAANGFWSGTPMVGSNTSTST